MEASRYEPYTPPKLVPKWAVKLTSAPKVETPQERRKPPPNAPRAPAAMSPALPHNVRSKRGGRRRHTPYKSSPPAAISIIDFATSTPTRQKFQPVIAPNHETTAKKTDAEIEREEDEELLRECMEVALRWDPLETKEFVPQRSAPKKGGGKRLDVEGAGTQDWVGGSRQTQQEYNPCYPLHFPDNTPFSEEVDLDAWEESKRQYQRQRQAEIIPIGHISSKERKVSAISRKKEVDAFEYSPAQRKEDYTLLLQGSEPDTIDPVYGLSYAPKFECWSAWRDEFTDRYLYAIGIEYTHLSNLLDEAFEVVQKSGLNMDTDGLEEVKRIVEVGHDFSQQGSHKFNEHMVDRTRSKMMRQAGAWRRISIDGEKYWFTGDEKASHEG